MISYTKNKYYIQFLRVFQFLVKANERKGEKERKEKRRWDHKQERNGLAKKNKKEMAFTVTFR